MFFPCYAVDAGNKIFTTSQKTIATIASGSYNTQPNFTAYAGGIDTAYGSTGFRQVTSGSGINFYMTGGSASGSGFYLLQTLTSTAPIPIIGTTINLPGYYMSRGIAYTSPTGVGDVVPTTPAGHNYLYGSSGPDDNNGGFNYNTVVMLGGAAGNVPTTATTRTGILANLPGFNMWTFV